MHPSNPVHSLFRSLARTVSENVVQYPALQRWLKSAFLALPPSLRGDQLVHDHFTRVARLGSQQFVLVGANDGVTDDHIYSFARKHRWKGVAVEPVPQYYEQLRQAYRGLPVACLPLAVHRTLTSVPFYFLDVDRDDRIPTWSKGLGSFDRLHLEASLSELGEDTVIGRIREIEVPCRSLDELVVESHFSRVDILIVDVEGYDAEVVRQMDPDRWKTHTIVYESKHLAAGDLNDLRNELRTWGFEVRSDGRDDLAIRM